MRIEGYYFDNGTIAKENIQVQMTYVLIQLQDKNEQLFVQLKASSEEHITITFTLSTSNQPYCWLNLIH